MDYKILEIDPYLTPYKESIKHRIDSYNIKKKSLLSDYSSLIDFANGYKYFGLHPTDDGWVYREWAPAADAMFFTGDFNNWDLTSHPMSRIENGVFEIYLDGKDTLKVGQKVQAIVLKNGEYLRRIPTYATRVVQDPDTYAWCAEVDDVLYDGFEWTDSKFKPSKIGDEK